MEKNIEFENAQKMKQQHPQTFYAPDDLELAALKPGDQVKVCTDNERFWTEVISVVDGIITSRVDNDLITEQLKYNDIITFKPENVYDILSSLKVQKKEKIISKAKKGKRLLEM